MKHHKAFPEQKKKVKTNAVFDFDISKFKNSDGKKDIQTAKHRKMSSTSWLTRALNDRFFQMSKECGFNSRASFKLIEIFRKYDLYNQIINSDTVLDLGCSPGGWTQVLEQYILEKELKINKKTTLIALDINETNYITNNITFIKGDFENPEIQAKITELSQGKIQLIVSDIAPDNIGSKVADRLTTTRIIESMINFVDKNLAKNGTFVFKSIKGSDESVFKSLKFFFDKIERFKPLSSRKESSEIFLICQKKK